MAKTRVKCYKGCIIWRSDKYSNFPYLVEHTCYGNVYVKSVSDAETVIDDCISNRSWVFCQCGNSLIDQPVSIAYENGNPASGISVSASPNFSSSHCSRSGTTDANGECSLSDLVSDKSYDISISPPANFTCDPSCTQTVNASSSTVSFVLKFRYKLSLSLPAPPSLSLLLQSIRRELSPISLSSLPLLSLSLQSFRRILSPLSLSALPALRVSELKNLRVFLSRSLSPLPPLSVSELENLLVLLSRPLPSLPSLSFKLKLISRELASLPLEDLPELAVSVLLFTFPRQPLSDAIVVENMNALAEASFEHHRRAQFSNFNAPPFICLICGETFNTIDDYISHLISHVQAYEEPEE